ncbi:MAG: hypothetical protein JW741_15055 [Sedimentisphaerales bacterium]|nr:hypothetical protein [Sedimentisphaerales bacterium]
MRRKRLSDKFEVRIPPPLTPRSRRAGVTLTEVVVASALLLVAIVPVLRAWTIAQVTTGTVERRTRSLQWAQRELERIKARSIYHYDDSFAETSRVLADGFLCTVADDGDPNLRSITVSVGLDRNGDGVLAAGETEVRLSTRLAKRWPGS